MKREDTKASRIDTLTKTQSARKQDCLLRVDKAIERLQKIGAKLNFHTIAKEANLSVSYLYKYPELKQRIAQIRSQQSSMPISPVAKPATSSHTIIVSRLKERIHQLEQQNQELRRKNEALAGQVYRVHYLQEQVSRQQQTIEDLQMRLKSAQADVSVAKVTLITQAKSLTASNQSVVSEKIKSELAQLGISLNSTLTKTIKSASSEMLLGAIEALKEAMASGEITRPGGWLNKAIKDGWIPNEKHLPQNKVERDIFKKWFDLAYKQRLVLASTKGEDGVMYVYTRDGVPVPFEQMLTLHPLEKLSISL